MRYSKRQTVIPNPSGTITYRTINVEPLIDLKYNDDIADALVSSSLVREKQNPRKWLWKLRYFPPDVQVLTVVLSRPTTGTLEIFEY